MKRSGVEKDVDCSRRRRCSTRPPRNILVERGCAVKHLLHIYHVRGVPLSNVLIERRSLPEHAFHSCHLRRVPTGDISVER